MVMVLQGPPSLRGLVVRKVVQAVHTVAVFQTLEAEAHRTEDDMARPEEENYEDHPVKARIQLADCWVAAA